MSRGGGTLDLSKPLAGPIDLTGPASVALKSIYEDLEAAGIKIAHVEGGGSSPASGMDQSQLNLAFSAMRQSAPSMN